MEHIDIQPMTEGYFRLTPESGYKLMNTTTGMLHSEAVTRDPEKFVAVDEK